MTPDAPIAVALAAHPLGAVRVDLRDGYRAPVVAVGLSRAAVCCWLDGRPAVPVACVGGAL